MCGIGFGLGLGVVFHLSRMRVRTMVRIRVKDGAFNKHFGWNEYSDYILLEFWKD